MDFGQVLHTAQRNEKSKDQKVRYYSTKFEPPKKEKKANQLSENIKKFLAKKSAEEKQKSDEARKKRDELLALRSQDKKATKRVNVMLKRTKSANQSVLEDAIDNDNTAVTLAGPMQPDEDDYGYVSQEASEYYNKMMEKYSKMPDEPKFDMTKKKVSTNLGSTKDRVKAALDREEEEAKLPHKRKRKHKDKKHDDDEEGISYDAPDRTPEDKNALEKSDKEKMPPPPPKPKPKPAPPPMNFAELLKIAEKKQFEPVIIEKQEKEEERLLTKKQRRDLEKERESQMRREEKRRHLLSSRIPKTGDKVKQQAASATNSRVKSSERPSEKQKLVKANGTTSDSTKTSNTSIKEESIKQGGKQGVGNKEKSTAKTSLYSNKKKKEMEELFPQDTRPGRKYLPGDVRYKSEQNTKPEQTIKQPPQKSSSNIPGNKQPEMKASPKESFSKKPLSNAASPQYQIKKASSDPKPSSVPQKKPSMEAQPKRFPPENVRRKVPQKLPPKQFPPPDVRRGNPKMVPNKRGRILDDDDEEEYDSEMDDFIDDDDAGEDISKYISEIFGYDRKRFRDDPDDVDNMETSFAQQMKEEVISTKMGIMEDLEEERKEEEAKRRKLLMKKKMRR